MRTEFAGPETYPQLNTIVGDFVSRGIWGEPGRLERYCSMAVFEDDILVAGIVYHNWHPDAGTIEISGAAQTSRWLTRPVLIGMMDFAFAGLNCQAIIARHSADNKRVRRMWRAVGSAEYIIPRLRGKDKPAECVSVLTDDAWTSFKEKHHGNGTLKAA